MLVLTCNLGQYLCVGNSIDITVHEVRGDQVCRAVKVPCEVSVDRKDITIQKENDIKAVEKVFLRSDPSPSSRP